MACKSQSLSLIFKNNKMENPRKIKFLENIIKKSNEVDDLLDDTERFKKTAELETELDNFIQDEENNFSEEEKLMNAEDLLMTLKSDNTNLDEIKSKLIGKKVSLDGGGDFNSLIKDVKREIINFEGEKDNNYKIILEGEDNYFIHSSAIDGFLNGEDTGAYLKGDEKGGSIMLINEEKNAFNDANLFVEEYKDYLIGKKIKYKSDENDLINDVYIEDKELNIETLNKILILYLGDFESFINGEEIMDDNEAFSLIIQEESLEIPELEEELINKPENRYYVINLSKRKIYSGHEYIEDANSDYEYRLSLGEKPIQVLSKKFLISSEEIDPDDNSNWLTNSNNYSIIEEALSYAVLQNDFDEESKNVYIDKYKNEGKYLTVIKANLIYYLTHLNTKFKNAISNSKYEEAFKLKESILKVSEELLNIIKKDI